VSVIAGNGTSGFSGDGGPATSASFSSTQGICIDALGNLYIVDVDNARIRKIDPLGIVTTVAGTGVAGLSGDGGPATSAKLNCYGVECDAAGNLLIGDWGNNRVRRVDATSGMITTVAGNGTAGSTGDGGPATSAGILAPIEAYYDANHNIYISEYGAGYIRRVDAITGTISTIATAASPDQIAISGSTIYVALQSGRVIAIDYSTGTTSTYAGGGTGTSSGVPATSTSLAGPQGVVADCNGNVFIADNDNNLIRKVDGSTGIITTIAGGGTLVPTPAGVPALDAKFHNELICLDCSGNLYVTTDEATVVYKVSNVSTCGPILCDQCDTLPIASFSVLSSATNSDTISVFMNTSSFALNYLWNFGDSTTDTNANPIHQFLQTGNYNVCLTAFKNSFCKSIFCKEVYVDVSLIVGIPSAFSPNGDGVNDILYARGKGIKAFSLTIYNRFGQIVFETSDINQGWDGRYKGQNQPIDTYSYVLHAVGFGGTKKVLKGNITLLK